MANSTILSIYCGIGLLLYLAFLGSMYEEMKDRGYFDWQDISAICSIFVGLVLGWPLTILILPVWLLKGTNYAVISWKKPKYTKEDILYRYGKKHNGYKIVKIEKNDRCDYSYKLKKLKGGDAEYHYRETSLSREFTLAPRGKMANAIYGE